ncbi:MAG: alpha/beta hydrolase [Pseudobacteriovorax sp.]|nr:alpha/beta hydrolase [Pseudobacteriovorax sp.]
MIFPIHAVPNIKHLDPPEDIEQRFLDTASGARVEYWFFQAPEIQNKPTIVYFHGNAETIDFAYLQTEALRREGYPMIFPEYRGYGRSSGKPSQEDITKDVSDILAVLEKEGLIKRDQLIFMGNSLGGGFAFDLARQIYPRAILVRSTFYSVVDMAKGYFAPSFLVKNPFRSYEVASSFDGPVFIAHGRRDRIIPFDHGQRLHEAAKNSVFYPVTAGHNDFPLNRPYWQAVKGFLEEHRL